MKKATFSLLLALVLSLWASEVSAQAAQLLYEDFQTTSGSALPAGWNNSDHNCTAASPASYIWKSNTPGYYPPGSSSSGQRCAYLYAYNNYMQYAALKTPTITLPTGRDAFLRFMYKNSTYGGSLDIYVSTDGGSTYLNNQIASGLNSGTAWQEFEVPVMGFTGQQITIVFVGRSSGSTSAYYYYLDNVAVELAPTCQAPDGLYFSGTTTTSINFNWGLKGPNYGFQPDTFHLTLLDAAGSVVQQATTVAPQQSYSFTGLTPNTTYTARVQSSCLANYKGVSDPAELAFHTLAAAQQLPYRENFDALTALPGDVYGSHATLNTVSGNAHGGSGKSLKLSTTVPDMAYVIFPQLDTDADDMEIDFWARRLSASVVMRYQIGYLTDPYDLSTFVSVARDSLYDGTAWQNVRLNTAALADQTHPVMPCILFESGAVGDVFIDDVDIHAIPTCTRPEQVKLSLVAASTAQVSWTMANAPQVVVRAMNLTDSTVVSFTATQSPFTLTGLTPQTDYRVTVQGVCSAQDSSQVSLPAEMRTLCDVAASAVFAENFDLLAANSAPECWTMGWFNKGTSTKTAPFSSSSTYKHGTTGKAMSLVDQPIGTVSYMTTQALPFDRAGGYDLSVWVYRQSASTKPREGIRIWVTPVADDTVGGVCLGYIPRHFQSAPAEAAANAWYQYEYNIPVQGTHYILIEGISEYGNATYFDDLEVSVAPTCRHINALELGQVTSTTAGLSWTAGGQESQWQVEYELSSGAGTVRDTVVTTTADYTIANLSPATPYNIVARVRAICQPGDTAEAEVLTSQFTTQCVPLTRLPYRQGFEDSEAGITGTHPFPACWTRVNDASSTSYNYYPYNYNSTTTNPAHSGAKMLYHYQSNSSSYADNPAAVLPEVDTQLYPVNNLRLRFWAAISYSGTAYTDGTIIVGVMTDPQDMSTFVDVDTIVIPLTNTAKQYARYQTLFTNYAGQGGYVALRFPKPTSKYNYIFVDDIVLDTVPSCIDLDYGVLTTRSVDEQSIQVVLTDTAAAHSWTLAYGPAGTPVAAMTTVALTDSAYTVTGLNSATAYELYARRDCGAGDVSPWSEALTVSTTAVPAEMPYVCGFEDATDNRQWQMVDAVSSNAAKNNFAIGYATDAVRTGQQALYVSPNDGESYTYTASSAASKSFAYRAVRFESKVYQITYNFRATGGEAAYDFGRAMIVPTTTQLVGGVGVSVTAANFSWPDNAEFLDPEGIVNANPNRLNCMPNTETGGWGRFEGSIDMRGRAGVYNLVFMWNNDGSGNSCGPQPLTIDDISIDELRCTNPASVNIARLTSDTVVLAYNQASAQGWEVIIDNQSINTDALPAAPLYRGIDQTGSVTLGSLTPNTQYYYTLRTICGAGDTANWLTPVGFRTYCTPFTLPYSEDFETGTIECWTSIVGSAGSVSRSTRYSHAGAASMLVDATSAVSPEFVVDSLTHYQLSGYAMATEDSVRMNVGLMVDPADPSSYENFGEVLLSRANAWQPFTVYFTDLSSDDYADYRSARHIVLVSGDKTVCFDDLVLELTPSCAQPTEAEIDQVTDSSFRISFRNNSAATDFIVRLDGTRTELIHTNPATITGLGANRDYFVELAAVCAANDTSRFTEVGTVRTACAPFSLPWTCGFEPEEGYPSATTYVAGALDAGCWQTLNVKPNGATYPYLYTTPSQANSGLQGLFMSTYSSATKTLYAILPEFDYPANRLTISCMLKITGSTASVGYMTDPDDETTYVRAMALPSLSSWTPISTSTDLIPGMPANARIAIALTMPSTGSTAAGIAIDDIVVNKLTSCAPPTAIVSHSITDTGADFTVSDYVSGHSNYEYAYAERGADPDRLSTYAMASAADTIRLAGLTPDTYYDIFVRAHCGTDTGTWAKLTFRTACVPFTVTEATPFFDSFETAVKDQLYAGCYTPFGMATTYFPKGYPNAYYTTSATPYWNRYARTGEMCINLTASKSVAPDGIGLMHAFRFEQGRLYKAQVYARAYSYASKAKLYFGTVGDIAHMRNVANVEIGNTLAKTIPATGDQIKCNDYAYAYLPVTTYFTVPQTGVYYIAVGDSVVGTNASAGLYIDDFSVEELTGCTPSPITVDSASGNSISASLDFFQPGETYEYCLINTVTADTVRSWTAVAAQHFTIAGIPSSTQYMIVCRRRCADGQTSEQTSVNAATECVVWDVTQATPFTDSFEYGKTHNSEFSGFCYEKGGEAGTYVIKSYGLNQTTHFAHSGNECLYMYSYKTSCPQGLTLYRQFHLRAGVTYEVMVWGRSTTYDSWLTIGYGTEKSNLADLGRFTISPCTATASDFAACWRRYKVTFAVPQTGDYYIGINTMHTGTNSYSYAVLDDLTVREQPSCPDADNAPIVNSTTKTTASVSVEMLGKPEVEVAWARNRAGITVDDREQSLISRSADVELTGLDSAAAYQVWYRMICAAGDTSVWSPSAQFTTKTTDCFIPENVRISGSLNDHHAELTWGRVPDATLYSYVLISGADTIAAGTTARDTIAFDSLTMNTVYDFRVSSDCGTQAEATLRFRTTTMPVATPFVCGFEDQTQNSYWDIRNITNGTNRLAIGTDEAAVLTGTHALYETADGTQYGYVAGISGAAAQVVLIMPAGRYHVNYSWKCKGENTLDYGRVFLLPASVDVSASLLTSAKLRGVLPEGSIELGDAKLNLQENWQTYDGIITVPENENYRLVVAVVADATSLYQPAFTIDDISVVPVVCDMPEQPLRTELTDTSAQFIVTKHSALTPLLYGVARVNNIDSVAGWTLMADTAAVDTITLTGLIPGTDYTLFVRHMCDSDNLSEPRTVEFRTTCEPHDLPYVCGFETTDDLTGWTMTDGGAYNRWMIGAGASYSGQRSLYVTADGVTHGYDGLSSTPGISFSYAYLPVNLAASSYQLDFDWTCNGESTFDYMRVFLLPASVDIPANHTIGALSASALPDGALSLDGNTKLNLQEDWVHASNGVVVPEAGVYNLVFFWHNDGSIEHQLPAAVDNINFREASCPTFATGSGRITYTSTDSTIALKVRGNMPQSAIGYHVSTTGQYLDTVAYGQTALGDSMIYLSGLQAGTRYYARLWAICDSGRTLTTPISVYFRSACGVNTVYPWTQGFEVYNTGSSYKTELQNNCWYTHSTEPTTAYHYVNTGTSAHSGTKGLYIVHGTTAATQTFGLPEMANLAGKHVSFAYMFNNLYAARLELGYLAQDSAAAFVALDTVPTQTTWTDYDIDLPQVALPQGGRLAFRTVSVHQQSGSASTRASAAYVYIDDIRINDRAVASAVTDTVCYGMGYNEHGLNLRQGSLAEGDTTFAFVDYATTYGVADTVRTVNLTVLGEIENAVSDTVCAGQPYNEGRWQIDNPQSTVYFTRFTSRNGCDSTVTLTLTVLPAARTITDTICQGDAYYVGDTAFTRTGTYTFNSVNEHGCTEQVTLHLTAIDSVAVTRETICGGTSFTFEGRSYNQSGVYRVPVQVRGCTQIRELQLTVLPSDSTINVSVCQGGQQQVVDTIITTAGSYDLRRVTSEGCDIVYHIHSIITPAREGHYTDDACEGIPYSGFGVAGVTLTADTTFSQNSRTADFCDSVTIVTVMFHPTQYGDTTATIGEDGTFEWHENTYTRPGDYQTTLRDRFGCDSVVTLHLLTTGVDNVADLGRMKIAPNPVRQGQTAIVFTENVGQVSRVEIINSFGSVIESREPHSTPLDVVAPQTAGIYHIRIITTDGRVYVEKLIVE